MKMKWGKKKKNKKKNKQKKPTTFWQMYRNTVDDWNVWFGGWRSRDFNCSGFIVILCKVSWNAFLHERSTGIKDERVGRGEKEGKGEKKRWRFEIYNLAWRNTVTSRHHINLCKSPYISPAFPSMLPNIQPRIPLSSLVLQIVLQMKHEPSTQKQTEVKKQINTSLLTDRTSTRPSTSIETRTHKKNRSTHSLVSRFFPFRLLRRNALSFILCLSARMKITPSDSLRCKITSVSPPV